ncbi:MAG: glycosyltransferase [Flavobacterium sp.]|nr:glycosyltransferase [Flavobacterium sp.]
MKVLHIISSINPKAGGVSQALVTIVKQLSSKGIVNEVVSLDSASANYFNSYDFKIYALGLGKTSWNYTYKLKQWLNVNLQQYDRIVVHGLWQYQSLAVFKAFRRLQRNRPKLFVMPHGMLDPYFQRAKARRIKAIRNYIIWHTIEYNLINTADGLLFTCEEEKLLARQTFKRYQPKKEIVVGLGVDAPPLFCEKMSTAFEAKLGASITKYWLFISRIHQKKGVDLLIKAYQALKKTGVLLPKLVIAGPGLETPYGRAMLKLADNNEDIYFPGMLSGDAKWGAFYGAELFILPSHQENFGIAVVEALACGLPVLISNKVNIWQEIEGMGSGIVINDDLAGVVDGITRWKMQVDSYIKQQHVSALNTYDKYFTVSTTSTKLLEVINN